MLALIVAGRTLRGVGRALGISHHTARTYLRQVYAKLGVSNRCAVTLAAARLGVIHMDGAVAARGRPRGSG